MENKNMKEEVTMETLNKKLDDIITGTILVSSMCGVFADIVMEKAKGKDVSDDKLLLLVLRTGSDAVSDYTQGMMKKYKPEEKESSKRMDEILDETIDEILKKVFNKK